MLYYREIRYYEIQPVLKAEEEEVTSLVSSVSKQRYMSAIV